MDANDVGLWLEPIAEGMVFSMEPGIYNREEKLGIRLEKDVLVTSGTPDDLFK